MSDTSSVGAAADASPAQKKPRSDDDEPQQSAAVTDDANAGTIDGAEEAMASSPPSSPESLGPALLAAAQEGDEELVEKLLDQRCDACYQDPATGQSALMLAAGCGHAAVVSELLISGAPYNALDREGRCAGNYAMLAGDQRIVDALVSAGVTAELLFTRMAARKRYSG